MLLIIIIIIIQNKQFVSVWSSGATQPEEEAALVSGGPDLLPRGSRVNSLSKHWVLSFSICLCRHITSAMSLMLLRWFTLLFKAPKARPHYPGPCMNHASFWQFQSRCFCLLLCKRWQRWDLTLRFSKKKSLFCTHQRDLKYSSPNSWPRNSQHVDKCVIWPPKCTVVALRVRIFLTSLKVNPVTTMSHSENIWQSGDRCG